jgi:hypothetical protein
LPDDDAAASWSLSVVVVDDWLLFGLFLLLLFDDVGKRTVPCTVSSFCFCFWRSTLLLLPLLDDDDDGCLTLRNESPYDSNLAALNDDGDGARAANWDRFDATPNIQSCLSYKDRQTYALVVLDYG